MIVDFIKKYKVVITAVLSILATLAALTATDVDDKLVANADSFVNEVTKDGAPLLPINVVNPVE